MAANQPRVPAGSPGGGQWVSVGGGIQAQLSTGTSSMPQRFNQSVMQLQSAFTAHDIHNSHTQLVNDINLIAGPSIGHSFGQKFQALRQQAVQAANTLHPGVTPAPIPATIAMPAPKAPAASVVTPVPTPVLPVPTPPTFDPTVRGADKSAFDTRVAQFQTAAANPDPQQGMKAVAAINVQSASMTQYQNALVAHLQSVYDNSPAGQAAASAKALADQIAQRTAAQIKSDASKTYAAQAITSYQPAKYTSLVGTPTEATVKQAAAQDKAAGSSFARSDTVDDLLNQKVGPHRNDAMLASIMDDQGFSGHPTVVSDDEFDKIVQGGGIHLVRSVQDTQYNKQTGQLYQTVKVSGVQLATEFQSGTHYAGNGVDGNGTYTATNYNNKSRKTAMSTSDLMPGTKASDATINSSRNYGNTTFHMALRPDARITTLNNLNEEYRKEKQAGWKTEADKSAFAYNDIGHYAASRGYDGYISRTHGIHAYFVLLNRTAVAVRKRLQTKDND